MLNILQSLILGMLSVNSIWMGVVRGGYCNYMHIKPCSKTMKKELMEQMHLDYPDYKRLREEGEEEKGKGEERG